MRAFKQCALFVPIALALACSDAPTSLAPHAAAGPNDLLAPPVVTVTNIDDAGAGSLRQAIMDAPDGAVIRFDAAIAGQTIALTSGFLVIAKNLTIEGPATTGMTISGNFSWRVFRIDQSNVTLRNLSIVNGRSLNGGGVLNQGTLTLDHSLIANNESEADGGGLLVAGAATQTTILNSTITGNLAGDQGGGIAAAKTVIIRNSTIAENTAVEGGGIYEFDGSLDVRNTIIAKNIDSDPATSSAPNCAFFPGLVPVLTGTNLSDDNTCGTGASIVIANPVLGPITSNGGPTKTLPLRIGSPAIDGATMCSEDTDQRYVARPQGATCDIGAFELDKFASVTLSLTPNVAVAKKTGVSTVTGSVSCSAPGAVAIEVALSQTQKVSGKSSTLVQASTTTNVSCSGPATSWSVVLTPTTGQFGSGDVIGSARTSAGLGFLPAAVTSLLRAVVR